MSIKVYIHFEEKGCPEKTSKIGVPKSWVANKLVSDVVELFTDAYNKANPEFALSKEEIHLQSSEGMKIYSDAKVEGNLENLFDYFIKRGAYVRQKVAQADNENEGKCRCKNYGCNKYFTEGDTEVCTHHTGPPVFHDLVKYWTCCPDKKAYDWDEFQKIEGCAQSTHSTVDPKVALGRGDNQNGGANDTTSPPVTVLKSISDYNTANPDAANSAASAVKVITQDRASSRMEDGTAKCRNKGCQKIFSYELSEAGNHPTACRYHKGQPVFHDAIKYWSCCAHKKCYDFDSFMEVQGCMVGYHDDGVIEQEMLDNAAKTV